MIVLQSGETSGMGRLPLLEKGIVAQLTQATHVIGVILEHRYYGTSFPTPDISTENLRFLTTEQALADQAFFSKNIKFPGLVSYTLSGHRSPRWDDARRQQLTFFSGEPGSDEQFHRPHRIRWLICGRIRLFLASSLPRRLLGSHF